MKPSDFVEQIVERIEAGERFDTVFPKFKDQTDDQLRTQWEGVRRSWVDKGNELLLLKAFFITSKAVADKTGHGPAQRAAEALKQLLDVIQNHEKST